MEAAMIQPTRAAPMDASSNRIRRGLCIRSQISHFILRGLRWPSLHKGFDSARITSMRAHPIPPVTEPLQYRAIGLVRDYAPTDPEQLTRGTLTDAQGVQLETVVLGRVLTLIRRHVL